MRQPLLELTQVTRQFTAGERTITVLKEINLTIYAGEMLAIVGQSGSGKSTLMNILGCLDRASSGCYRIDGRDTKALANDELAALRREYFGFIFQRYHLLPYLSAAENVELPALYTAKPKTQRRARAHQLLTQLGLGAHTTQTSAQLSGGQQQRVSIARALMNGGNVILADEPTGALDSRSGDEVMAVLHQLHQLGHTVILVTHNHEIAQHAERVIEIHDGKVVADTTHPQLHPRHQHLLPNTAASASTGTLLDELERFSAAFKMAWIALTTHRMRTLLTMLGIIIGITSVTCVVGLGQGTQQKIFDDINSHGSNTITFYPGREAGDDSIPSSDVLTPVDLMLLQQQPYVDSTTVSVDDSLTLRYRNIKVNAQVNGVSAQHFRVQNTMMSVGSSFSEREVSRQAQLVVIDNATRAKLFPHTDPLGKVILVGTVPCMVIGVTRPKDISFSLGDGSYPDRLEVFVPYTTAMKRLLGTTSFSSIRVRVRAGIPNDLAEKYLNKLVSLRHGRKDFMTYSSDSTLKMAQKVTGAMTLFISAIAVVSLLVAGIGVMNIMLVSVTERIHEIGIRMAVGARQHDIMQQFLVEAVLVCLLGGIVGVALSYAIGLVFSLFAQSLSIQFSILSIVVACTCCTLIGVIFGYLPARNAARLDPIEALARE